VKRLVFLVLLAAAGPVLADEDTPVFPWNVQPSTLLLLGFRTHAVPMRIVLTSLP